MVIGSGTLSCAAPEVGDSPRTPCVSPITGCEQDELELPMDTVPTETTETEVVEKGNDPFQPEGTIKYELSNVTHFSTKHDSVLSPPVYIRDLPWRLLVIPREPGERPKSLGVFVQCNPQGPEIPLGWTCLARATIRLINRQNANETISKDINHCFNAKENDWGYSNLATFEEILDTSKGFLVNDTIKLEAHVMADAPHGINWDSKKHTGYVGLKNQGATCYMNSLLQTLYFTRKLRQAVYLMPTEHDDPVKSVPLAMQRIFFDLQHNDKSVGTKKLTKSFGWDTVDVFMQHDVQELSRVLLDNLENKMKGTVVEGTIPKLFEGKMESYVRCTNVDYRSCREEPFFDIQLNVKGKKNVKDSFKDYVAEETLEGDNKYDAGNYGLQEAKKGVIFTKLPPVVHLHLMRFLYDPITDSNVKINDYFEFPEKLDLEEFIKSPEDTPATYTLHSVLVHSGDNYGGHYVVYLNPDGAGKWLKFDDDVVSRCSKKEAVDYNYGGNEDGGIIRSCTSAYMLVYIRDSHLEEILQEVKPEDIPDHLKDRFAEEKRVEAQRRKERNEALLYFTIEVYKDDDFQHHVGPDLYSPDAQPWAFKVLKAMSMEDFRLQLSTSLGYPLDAIRIWPFETRSNNTLRPAPFPEESGIRTVFDYAEKTAVWRIFVEMLSPDSEDLKLSPYNHKHDVLLFFKYYNPLVKSLSYVMHSIESVDSKFCDLFPKLCEAVGLPTTTPLDLYEEVKPNMIEQIDPRHYLRQLEDIRDGDIICFQRADVIVEGCELPTVDDFFRDLYNRVEVTFCNRADPTDVGFTLVLNQKMNYLQVARAAADYLQVEPQYIQFFKPSHLRNTPDVPIRWNAEGCLRDFMLLRHRMDLPPILYYQILSIEVMEFENKRCFKCVFISANLKEERDLTIYVSKQSLVGDLLKEAAKELMVSWCVPCKVCSVLHPQRPLWIGHYRGSPQG
jgi:ubiquitin carboxyl-terminal hydrolase 7